MKTWKFLGVIIGAISAVVIFLIGAQNYFDSRYDNKFFERAAGLVLTQKLEEQQKSLEKLENKMDNIQSTNQQILIELGKIQEKLDR